MEVSSLCLCVDKQLTIDGEGWSENSGNTRLSGHLLINTLYNSTLITYRIRE